ncbi:MAG: hybrid sensor histidine kinase/response regulator [Planctomycetes bacterium]|nr:hybrid sensor histidine kinase/response regulator [Planctomycetota bacterium]
MHEVLKLLVVDDDAVIRRFFAKIFAGEGFRIESAANGAEALERIRSEDYDVVVTDLCMPRMDGLRLIRELHRTRPGTAVLAITGYGTIRDTVALMKNGAFDVLTKPFSLEEIRLAVDKAVRHHRLARKNRELEHRLKTAEKLAGIGKLAAGVAHEINNPLDAAIRFVNLALADLADDPDRAAGYLADAHAGLQRIAGIVRSLLDFSRTVACDRAPGRLADLIREAVVALRPGVAAPGVNVEYDLADGGVFVARGYFHVFTNLIKNALDALASGGRLNVAARPDGDGVTVSFTDTGPGIPQAIGERVFEPFFTTKPPGQGTGLGLSISRQIVEQLSGRLDFVSQPGAGTTFTVWCRTLQPPAPAAPRTGGVVVAAHGEAVRTKRRAAPRAG